jgi:hypothetical protein
LLALRGSPTNWVSLMTILPLRGSSMVIAFAFGGSLFGSLFIGHMTAGELFEGLHRGVRLHHDPFNLRTGG